PRSPARASTSTARPRSGPAARWAMSPGSSRGRRSEGAACGGGVRASRHEGMAPRVFTLDKGPLAIARPPARARAEQLERVGQVLEAAGEAAQAAEHAQHVVNAPFEEGPGPGEALGRVVQPVEH